MHPIKQVVLGLPFSDKEKEDSRITWTSMYSGDGYFVLDIACRALGSPRVVDVVIEGGNTVLATLAHDNVESFTREDRCRLREYSFLGREGTFCSGRPDTCQCQGLTPCATG